MPEHKRKKLEYIHVKDIYFADMAAKMKKGLMRTLVQKVFYRPVRKHTIHRETFLIDFGETKLRWYSNLLNALYIKLLDGFIHCFFTDEGALVIIFMVYGNPDAVGVLEMPESKEAFVEDREATQKKKKKNLEIDKESIQESVEDDGYHLQYEETYKDHGKETKIFEHIVYSGIDKLVFRAIVPPEVSPETYEDIVSLGNSFRIRN